MQMGQVPTQTVPGGPLETEEQAAVAEAALSAQQTMGTWVMMGGFLLMMVLLLQRAR